MHGRRSVWNPDQKCIAPLMKLRRECKGKGESISCGWNYDVQIKQARYTQEIKLFNRTSIFFIPQPWSCLQIKYRSWQTVFCAIVASLYFCGIIHSMKPAYLRFIGIFLVYYIILEFAGDFRAAMSGWEVTPWFLRDPVLIFTTLLSFLFQALVVYGLFWKVFSRYGVWPTIGALILTIPLLILSRYLIQEVFGLYVLGKGNYNPGFSISYYLLDNVYYTALFTFPSFLVFLVEHSAYQRRARQEAELMRSQAELTFLKAQINPHFLFNTLNSIYSLAYQKSPTTLKAIEQLSELLRYTLYEKAEVVTLSSEISYLRNYIALQQLRYPAIRIELAFDDTGDAVIPPFTLIPLVENAFKHGHFTASNEVLRCILKCDDRSFTFSVENPVSTEVKSQLGGVGLENVRRRLELQFPEKFELSTTRAGGIFSTTLHLRYI
jgi:two-component system, LytTR family, sensor kinase